MPTPKSKDSKRKARRWQYEVTAVRNGTRQTTIAPAMTIGNCQDARQAALSIRDDLSHAAQFEGAVVSVKPVGCEVVSSAVLNQMTGLQSEARLLGHVVKNLVTAQLTAELGDKIHDPETGFENVLKERMGKAIVDGRNEMLAEQKAQADKAAAALGGDAVLTATLDPNELEHELELTDPKVGDAIQTAFDQALHRADAMPDTEAA